MKKTFFVLVILCFFAVPEIHGQSPKLTLYFPDSLNNALYNPDSVKIDTCSASSTFGDVMIKRGIRMILPIKMPWFSPDTIIEVTWAAIDTSYHTYRAIFQNIYDSIGPYVLRKLAPSDTTATGYMFEFRFLSYSPAVVIYPFLSEISGLHMLSSTPQVPCSVPNDQGMAPGTPITAIQTGTADVNDYGAAESPSGSIYHKLGWSWSLYKIKCPMAWEITEGRNTAPYVYILDGDEWSCSISDGEMSNFVQINSATSVKHVSSNPLEGNHGMDCMSQAIAGINNRYPMVGVAPQCTGLGINGYI